MLDASFAATLATFRTCAHATSLRMTSSIHWRRFCLRAFIFNFPHNPLPPLSDSHPFSFARQACVTNRTMRCGHTGPKPPHSRIGWRFRTSRVANVPATLLETAPATALLREMIRCPAGIQVINFKLSLPPKSPTLRTTPLDFAEMLPQPSPATGNRQHDGKVLARNT